MLCNFNETLSIFFVKRKMVVVNESNSFSVDILPQLEEELQQQIQNNTYNFESNLAILRLYLTYPEKRNIDVIRKILSKALMNLPEIDFNLSLNLLHYCVRFIILQKNKKKISRNIIIIQ